MNEYAKMTKQQEFRKQTEEAKFEAFSLMCKKVAVLEKVCKDLSEKFDYQVKQVMKLERELENERNLNAEIKARFVKCNTCTDEMKSKCLMFSENLCEGERCEELVDLMALVSKNDLQKENEQLKAQIEKMKCCENCKHKKSEVDRCELLMYTMNACLCKNKDKWEINE